MGGVHAVVVTHERKALLLACLDALARQTHPVDRVTVVDNASTDGTWEALAESGLGERMAVDYLRLPRNGGGAEGFHYGVRAALRGDAEWLWLMDDDCEPEPDSLAELLAAPRARDPRAILLAPLVQTPAGEVLPLNRGWLRPRWFKAPLVPLRPEHWRRDEIRVEHVSLVGPLVRAEAARRTEPPRRDFFIWFDDLEWTARLRTLGELWLIPAGRMTHRDERPLPDASPRALLRDLVRGHEFAGMWKRAYGLRNIIWTGRRERWFSPARAISFTAVAALRALLSGPPRLRSLRLTLLYARDGWRGRFRNVAPERWPALADAPDPVGYLSAHSLEYGSELDAEVRRLTAEVAS
jgi:rhamnopyranosyl-N-acetylglucosaminyl-diphospho-decaprenol beta-1,3/1,4-galactofuranosyltransferase